jgi:hypothetical protein
MESALVDDPEEEREEGAAVNSGESTFPISVCCESHEQSTPDNNHPYV